MLDSTRAFWVTKGADGSLLVATPDYRTLAGEARQLYMDEARFETMKRTAYTHAIDDMLGALERQGASSALRAEAAALLKSRAEAIEKLAALDRACGEEMEAAKRANKAADQFALAQTLMGLGSTVLAEHKTGNGLQVTSEVKTVKIDGSVIQLIQQRVTYQNKLIHSDTQINAFVNRYGQVQYAPILHQNTRVR